MITNYDPRKARCFQNYVTIYLIVTLAFSLCLGPIASVTAAHHFGDYLTSKAFGSKVRSAQLRPAASSAVQLQPKNSCQTAGSRLNNQVRKILIPPLLIFLLSISKCDASVLNPQSIAIRGPFFQGWLMRTIDHENSRSFILIIGSFSAKGSKKYDEHYIFCGVDIKGKGTLQFEAFPQPDTVTIEGSSPTLSSPFPFRKSELSKNTNITWAARDIGHFRFSDDECSAEFKLDGALIKFSSNNRLAWSKSDPHFAGPEGWLGYTSLLPCHYFVHSVGSECRYSLQLPSSDEDLVKNTGESEGGRIIGIDSSNNHNRDDDDDDDDDDDMCNNINNNVSDNILNNICNSSSGISNTCSSNDESSNNDNMIMKIDSTNEEINKIDNNRSINGTRTTIYSGEGFTHIEGNHGSFFPSGWVWSQAIQENNVASFSLTGGKFEIGLFAPITFILFVRIDDMTKIFRTTGFDQIQYNLDGCTGTLNLTAYSFSKKDKVELVITPQIIIKECSSNNDSIRESSFGFPLYIPTADGFKNTPGCIETYTATANLILYEFDTKTSLYAEVNKIQFPLTALEFGGTFQGLKLQSGGYSQL